jgi:hypothetical protein
MLKVATRPFEYNLAGRSAGHFIKKRRSILKLDTPLFIRKRRPYGEQKSSGGQSHLQMA